MRLIGPWCQVNIGSCRFMLAQCYLADGEGQKVGGKEGLEDRETTEYQCVQYSVIFFIAIFISASPLCSSGSAVFPGGGDGGGEGGVPDETDEQRGRGGRRQHQAAVLQQGA